MTTLPCHSLPPGLEVSLHSINAHRDAVDERERFRVFRQHRREDDSITMHPKGQREGNYDSDRFQTRTLRYSLRRVSPLDSVNCGTHNPKVGGSNPPPATNFFKDLEAPVIWRFLLLSVICPCPQKRMRPSYDLGRDLREYPDVLEWNTQFLMGHRLGSSRRHWRRESS